MAQYAPPVLFALLLWWFSTGAVLYLIGLPKRTFVWTMLGATAVLAAALAGLSATSADATAAGAYGAFTCGLLVWAWHEMSFLTGFVTGPRDTACPKASAGLERFGFATAALIYHELAILATGAVVLALTWGAVNQVGALTFLVLWIMRLSAKVNVFLGVPNLTEEFLPPHLEFLKSYFRKAPMNLFFPVSVTAATVATAWTVERAAALDATAFEAAGYTLVATLMALAVIEHWFLVLPLPAAALWTWGLASRGLKAPADESLKTSKCPKTDRSLSERRHVVRNHLQPASR